MRREHKSAFIISISGFFIVSALGCAAVLDGAKGIAGVSTKSLEENRKSAMTATFNYDYKACFDRTADVLSHMGVCIYAKDAKKQMFAFYISEEDTTPVGVFLKAIDAGKTQVEVSSLSTSAREFISRRLFAALEKPVNQEEEKKTDDKKDAQNK